MYLSVTIIIIITPIYNVHPTPECNKNAGGQVQIRHIYYFTLHIVYYALEYYE